MRRITRIAVWVLLLSMCISMIGVPAYAADSNMTYLYNSTAASADNELVTGEEFVVGELDASKGTHQLQGLNLYSGYADAFVWGTKHASETEPVIVDANGKKYYVGAAHSTMESYGFYVDDYYVDGQHYYTPEGERTYARWATIQNFVLADAQTQKLSTAYCVDAITPAVDGTYYNIENLENASYYTSAQARMIRTIALNGYWGQASGTGSLAAMQELLAASGEFTAEELALLTDGVAMTATQYAIWHYSNAQDDRKHISAYWYGSGSAERVSEEQKASVDLIFKIYYYLIDMDPASVDSTTANTVITEENFLTSLGISNAVLIDGHENNLDTNEDNDAYTADLSFTMAVLPSTANGDDLVAKVVDAEGNVLATGRIVGTKQDGEIQLASDGNGKYTFQDLTLIEGIQNLNIQLEGHQELKQGVYLYNPVGGRDVSQTLLGVAEGTHQVDVALDWDLKFSVNEPPERIITITKKSTGGLALEGIQFDFYYVAGREEYLLGEVELPDATDYAYGSVADYTIITDANGEGTFNLTENNLPDGVYLVVEREHPAIVAPVDPFYVIMPATSEDGRNLEYVIDIYPKNDVRGNVDIEKDVIEIGNNESTQDAYAAHTWIIGTTIPADIGQGKSFVISDTLDNRLDFLGNVRVQVENAEGTMVAATLTNQKDYILNVNDVDSLSEGNPSDSFTVSLTRSGMEKVEGVLASGVTHIRVYFDAQINANAEMGAQIPNQATLDYTNSIGVGFHVESDEPYVYTGGIQLLKVDADNADLKLANAEFKVYRIATAAEVADDSIVKETFGDSAAPMVAVEFFSTPDLSGEKTDTAVSGADGKVYIYGLAYGTYYLVETKAPAGYNLLGDPTEFTINADSHTEAAVMVVENTSGTVLPETGGIGTHVFYIGGILLILAAAVLLLKKRRAF